MRRRKSRAKIRHPYGSPEEWWRRANEYSMSPLFGGQGEALKFAVTCRECLGTDSLCTRCNEEQDPWIAATYSLAGREVPEVGTADISEMARSVFS